MSFRLALAQLNLLVGDIEGNADKVIETAVRARDKLRADVVVFPELTLTGYPPEDLVLRTELDSRVEQALARIAAETRRIDVVLGYPAMRDGVRYNAAGVLRKGELLVEYHKCRLPNYGVFDEVRYFTPGTTPCVFEVRGVRVGLSVCEDVWFPGPTAEAVAAGAEFIVNLNASPYYRDKPTERESLVADRIAENRVPMAYINLVGGQDELVFDGGSFVMDGDGHLAARAAAFDEQLLPVEINTGLEVRPRPGDIAPYLGDTEAVYRALVTGTRDYVVKNGFDGVIVGLSGGIDSALTLAVAVDALSGDRVEAVLMPSRYTAELSISIAEEQARLVGVEHRIISIEPVFEAFLDALSDEFGSKAPDITEENIQARCRGIILMALSNKLGRMLLTTGNKSEMSVGYATLYGDMAGGFAPLKDVPKTLVYELAKWRNRDGVVIPERVIARPPSAELRPEQLDTDSLPPYDVLDAILERYVERDLAVDDIVADGYERELVLRIAGLVMRSEYKRRQAPPGVKITRKAFGRDRRYPITSGF